MQRDNELEEEQPFQGGAFDGLRMDVECISPVKVKLVYKILKDFSCRSNSFKFESLQLMPKTECRKILLHFGERSEF